MLQTIEVEIDDNGHIHPLEPLTFKPTGRALLTLLNHQDAQSTVQGSGEQALALLASRRFANRPVADPKEVEQRINASRDEG